MTSESQSPLSFLPSLRKHSSLPHIFSKPLDNLSVYAAVISKHMPELFIPHCESYILVQVSGIHQGLRGKQHYWVRREGFLLKDRRLGFEAPSLGFNNCGPCVMTWVQSPGPTWWRERSDSHKLSPSLRVCTVHVYPPTQQMNKKVST